MRHMKNKKLLALCLTLMLIIAGAWYFGGYTVSPPANGILQISVIDVGQGDCSLISYAGKNILIDSGTDKSYFKIDKYLQSIAVDTLDYLVMTHPHADHIGAMDDVLENYEVDTLLKSEGEYDSAVYEKVMDLAYIHAEDILNVDTGDTFFIDDLKITVLSPTEDFSDGNINNMSVVLLLELGDFSAIFCGDAEKNAEKEMLLAGLPQVDFIKIGHHGSYTSSTEKFIQALSPEYAAISLGRDNQYGYPHELPQKNLKAVGSTVYRTDTQGIITVQYDGTDTQISTEK